MGNESNRSTKSELVPRSTRSQMSSQQILVEWLAKMAEHYRQPISEISASVYRMELSDLSAAEMDAACRRAIRMSEFLPTVATIRNSLKEIQSFEETPSTFIRYPEIDPSERVLTEDEQKQMDELKKKLGILAREKSISPNPKSPDRKEKKIYTPRATPKSIADQKAELRRKGYAV
jgi:hypothetical protein